jgi:hypothetical protein
MTANVEVCADRNAALRERLERTLHTRLGVNIAVGLEAPGKPAELTQVESRQKSIRSIDERKG